MSGIEATAEDTPGAGTGPGNGFGPVRGIVGGGAPALTTETESLLRSRLRCLAKDPADRDQDAESLERALAACESAGSWSQEQAGRRWADVASQPPAASPWRPESLPTSTST